MSTPSEIVSQAASVDWNLVAAAAATFLGTLVVTMWGWFQGKKKLAARLESGHPIGSELQVTGAVLLDNQTIRESTLVSREVRDQLLLNSQALHAHCKSLDSNTHSIDDVLQELKDIRRSIDKLPTRP